MAQTLVVEKIQVPLDRAWAELGNFAGLRPGSGIESVDYTGEGVGMTRTIHLAIGTVVERLDHYDASDRTYSYSIINGDSPLPFANYSATVRLAKDGEDSTTVEWTGSFEPRGVDKARAEALAASMYSGAIAVARKSLGAG